MAQITESGGRRSLNSDLNLVPFIDLLSVCICFLLVAAVWLKLGSVPVKQSFGTEAPETPQDTFELAIRLADATHLRVEILKGRQVVQALDAAGKTKEELAAAFGTNVESILTALAAGRTLPPDVLITAATVHAAKAAPYGTMVAVMDVLRKHQISNLAVAGG